MYIYFALYVNQSNIYEFISVNEEKLFGKIQTNIGNCYSKWKLFVANEIEFHEIWHDNCLMEICDRYGVGGMRKWNEKVIFKSTQTDKKLF